MSRRGDNIHKRKDGRWEGRYIQCRDCNGKAKYASVYAKTYAQAKEKLIKASNSKTQKYSEEICFSTVLFLWLNSKKTIIKKSTYSKYKYMIEQYILPTLGDKKINKLTSYEINCFLDSLLSKKSPEKPLSNSYVRTISVIVSCAHNFAANEGMCEALKNPVFKPIICKKEPALLSENEYQKLIRFICEKEQPDAVSLAVLITLFTGLRIGEICALKWSDIDTKKRIITINSTVARSGNTYYLDSPKTAASARQIPINNSLLYYIKKADKNGVFLLSQSEEFIHPRTFEMRYKKLLKSAKIDPINYHSLRHTFATKCIEAGMDVKSLSEILGHANCTITLSTYVHPSMEQKCKQIDLLYT